MPRRPPRTMLDMTRLELERQTAPGHFMHEGEREVDRLRAAIVEVRRDARRRDVLDPNGPGLQAIARPGDTPAMIRNRRMSQVLGMDDAGLAREARRELKRMKREEREAKKAADQIRRQEAREARERRIAEDAEETRQQIAKRTNSKFRKVEAQTRYGQDVQLDRHMHDKTPDEQKREYLLSNRNEWVRNGKPSIGRWAKAKGLNTETMRQYLLAAELLEEVHEKTGAWVAVSLARRSILEGWKPGMQLLPRRRGKAQPGRYQKEQRLIHSETGRQRNAQVQE